MVFLIIEHLLYILICLFWFFFLQYITDLGFKRARCRVAALYLVGAGAIEWKEKISLAHKRTSRPVGLFFTERRFVMILK